MGQSDPNLTIYKITLEREESGIIYEGAAYLRYVSQGVETVASPIQAQDLTNTYYHVYNYQHSINLVNDTIISALYNLQDNMVEDGAYWQPIAAPYLEWDAGSCTASLLIPNRYWAYTDGRLLEHQALRTLCWTEFNLNIGVGRKEL